MRGVGTDPITEAEGLKIISPIRDYKLKLHNDSGFTSKQALFLVLWIIGPMPLTKPVVTVVTHKSHGYDEVDDPDTHVVSPALPPFVILQPAERKGEFYWIMFVYITALTRSRISNIIYIFIYIIYNYIYNDIYIIYIYYNIYIYIYIYIYIIIYNYIYTRIYIYIYIYIYIV